MREIPMHLSNGVERYWPYCLELRIELLWPERLHAAGRERTADPGPVCFHEAEHPVNRDIVIEQSPHHLDLLEDSVNEFGAVA